MTPQRSKLYTMKYELVDEPGKFLEIATTRPETLMGDTGVAVNPKDERYAGIVGKMVRRPFPPAEIPVVADDHVDIEFGTGALKVTPAHDQADFEIGERHAKCSRRRFAFEHIEGRSQPSRAVVDQEPIGPAERADDEICVTVRVVVKHRSTRSNDFYEVVLPGHTVEVHKVDPKLLGTVNKDGCGR